MSKSFLFILALSGTCLSQSQSATPSTNAAGTAGDSYAKEVCEGFPSLTYKCLTDVSFTECNGGNETEAFVLPGMRCEQGIVCSSKDSIVFEPASITHTFPNSQPCSTGAAPYSNTTQVATTTSSSIVVPPSSTNPALATGSAVITSIISSDLSTFSASIYSALSVDIAALGTVTPTASGEYASGLYASASAAVESYSSQLSVVESVAQLPSTSLTTSSATETPSSSTATSGTSVASGSGSSVQTTSLPASSAAATSATAFATVTTT